MHMFSNSEFHLVLHILFKKDILEIQPKKIQDMFNQKMARFQQKDYDFFQFERTVFIRSSQKRFDTSQSDCL